MRKKEEGKEGKKEEGKKGREVGSLGERISWFQPAQTRILFAGSSSRSPAAHPQPGGRIITPAQRRIITDLHPGLLELGLKSVWEREDIEDPVTKGISCETFTVHHRDGQFEAFPCDHRD